MMNLWLLWALALCVTGILFWLAFRFWLESDEARTMRIDDLIEDDERDWIERQYDCSKRGRA